MSQSLIIAIVVIAAIVVVIAIVAVLARTMSKSALHKLPDESKDRYARSWQQTEARFIQDPRAAVQDADKVAVGVLSERGANVAEEKRMPDDLRSARQAMREDRGSNDTERMRQAMVHYKKIVSDGVGTSRLQSEMGRREMAS